MFQKMLSIKFWSHSTELNISDDIKHIVFFFVQLVSKNGDTRDGPPPSPSDATIALALRTKVKKFHKVLFF